MAIRLAIGNWIMSRYIPIDLRDRVRDHDQNRCCYCLTTELNSGIRMVFDHIFPRSQGGKTAFDNICLACRSCNEFKSDTVLGADSISENLESLFHPRSQIWSDHFEWNFLGTEVQGKTGVGRVTIVALRMNHDSIVSARRRWVAVGWHPPD